MSWREGMVMCLVLLLAAEWSAAADRAVSTSEQLAAAVKEAKTGDRIVIAAGKYVLSAQVTVAPLTIAAVDAKDRWSGVTPDGVHAARIGLDEKPRPTHLFFPKTPEVGTR